MCTWYDKFMQKYRIILEGGQSEIVEKKSRFIATLRPISTQEEAVAFIDEMKKKYWDARHNCSAFVLGEHQEITRCSDDGEPSGTAGRPMLEVLLGYELHNTVVVVTRYFGGTLLGAGGLVRAYSQAVKEGIKSCVCGTLIEGYHVKMTLNYTDAGKVLNYFKSEGQEVENTEYMENVTIEVMIACKWYEERLENVVSLTAGKALIETLGRVTFLDKNLSD